MTNQGFGAIADRFLNEEEIGRTGSHPLIPSVLLLGLVLGGMMMNGCSSLVKETPSAKKYVQVSGTIQNYDTGAALESVVLKATGGATVTTDSTGVSTIKVDVTSGRGSIVAKKGRPPRQTISR